MARLPEPTDTETVLDPDVKILPIPTGAGGIVRGPTITVTGTATCRRLTLGGGVNALDHISEVAVRLGASGEFVVATPTGSTGPVVGGKKTWSTWTTDALPITGVVNDVLQITARVTAGEVEEERNAIVTVDRTPPVLDLTTPDDMTQAVVNGKTTFQVAGTARDERSPVVAVEWVLDQGQQFTLATPKSLGDWSSWTAAVPVSPAGTHQLFVRARDGEANIARATPVTLRAVDTFQPPDPSDVFGPAGYLDDLLKFAGRRMVDGRGQPLTPAQLTAAYHQRFADLSNPNHREAATAPVHQVRVCVEVLRDLLAASGKPPVSADEANYRQAAYAALLRNLGTSVKEIRRARADEAARAAIIGRLGVDRPDRLDQLVLLPAQLTEAKLEQIFGLQDTTRDPLVPGPQPRLLTWQLDRLRAQWQAQDSAARVHGEIRVPVIDPDLLDKPDFRTRNAIADPAFALWTARRAEMAALVKQIDELRKSKATPLAGFDAVVTQFVAKIEELAAALADYRAGKDVTARLAEKRLSLPAFLHLMQSRDLAAAGTVLDGDWGDVYAIAAQVAKLGRYAAWRDEELAKGIVLGPDHFAPRDLATPPPELPEWRASLQARRAVEATVRVRVSQQQDVVESLRMVADAAAAEALPALRDRLVAAAGAAAQGLLIDLAGGAAQRTTRLAQAIETLQGALFAVRIGAVATGHPAAGWKLDIPAYTEEQFDQDWAFWGTHETWQGAMRVFIYPESHLLPTLRPETTRSETTQAFRDLITRLRSSARITPKQAREEADRYLTDLRRAFPGTALPAELTSPAFKITDRMTDSDLAQRQVVSVKLMSAFTAPHLAPGYLQEVFYFVPLLCALQLSRSGEYLAALDWFQTVYAYHLPVGVLPALPPGTTLPADRPLPDRRHIYYGLTLDEHIQTKFQRPANWPREGLNPHDVVRDRAGALTRFVGISLVHCFEQFADAEFTRDTDESVARARTLYQTALDLLAVTYPATAATTTPPAPVGLDPMIQALRLHAEVNLRKLRLGRNIAGLERQRVEPGGDAAIAPTQPTPYRYAALVARARELGQTAAQMEAALLAALEKLDAQSYNLIKAVQDIELLTETVRLHDQQVIAAGDGVGLAELQKGRAQIQFDHFDSLIKESLNHWEIGGLIAEAVGSALVVAGGVVATAATGGAAALVVASSLSVVASSLSVAGGAAGAVGSFSGHWASLGRREQDWRLQRNLAEQDIAIGGQQIALANDQVAVAAQEHRIASLQRDHAAANVRFLAEQFTGPELYEFMTEILDRVYRFFLQQATAMAKLAENQLAFERQEPPQGVIQGDYYAPPDGARDRRGITGSARLLADIVELDQHAFLTDRRRQQLTRTFSLAQLAPVDFARFRETGVMVIGTPQALFDRDFPGHYLRLVKRVRTSVIALIPPADGIRATLSTSGTSRVVVGGDTFQNALVRRDPETVGLTSPRDATGLFELVPDSQPELLLPFEGTGVDTIWRFELPKAANQFDYATIADVLLTIDYTALNSFDYRQQVIQTLDPELSLDRPFSFSQQFPDQWYELHNSEQTATPMTVRFKTARGDFLPNLDDLRIEHLVLYLAPVNGKPVEVRGARLLFKNRGDQAALGGSADSLDGIISTRRANGSNWLPITGGRAPVGEWELTLPADSVTRNLFRNEEIADILFVITYAGRTPEWPV